MKPGVQRLLSGQSDAKTIVSQSGQLISGEGEFLSQKQVFVLETVTEADRIIRANRANDAGIKEAADGWIERIFLTIGLRKSMK